MIGFKKDFQVFLGVFSQQFEEILAFDANHRGELSAACTRRSLLSSEEGDFA